MKCKQVWCHFLEVSFKKRGWYSFFIAAKTNYYIAAQNNKNVCSVSAGQEPPLWLRRFICSGFHKVKIKLLASWALLGRLWEELGLLAESRSCGCRTEVTISLPTVTRRHPLAPGGLSPVLARGSCIPEPVMAPGILSHTESLWLFLLLSSWIPAGESFLLLRVCMIRLGPPDNPGLS